MTTGVVIVTRNRPMELSLALSSLSNEDSISEIVIVRNDSFNYTYYQEALINQVASMLSLCGKKIKWVLGGDVSLSALRIKGLQSLNTEHVLFMDDDAVLASGLGMASYEMGEAPFLALGCQDTSNVGMYADWRSEPEPSGNFFRYRKEENALIKYDLGLFRRYEPQVKVVIPYCAGTCLMRVTDALSAYQAAVGTFTKGVPKEDIFVSAWLCLNKRKWGVFNSRFFVYHLRHEWQERFWNNTVPATLREVLQKVESEYKEIAGW